MMHGRFFPRNSFGTELVDDALCENFLLFSTFLDLHKVEPRYNEPQYNEDPGVTNDILQPSNSKNVWKKKPI